MPLVSSKVSRWFDPKNTEIAAIVPQQKYLNMLLKTYAPREYAELAMNSSLSLLPCLYA